MKKFLDIEGLRYFWEIILDTISDKLQGAAGGVKELLEVEEKGFFLVDENMNIGFKYDEQGLDTHAISQHFRQTIGSTPAVGGIDYDDIETI